MDIFHTPILFYKSFDALALLTEFLAPLETEDGRTILKENFND
jgi:hypothetical protein